MAQTKLAKAFAEKREAELKKNEGKSEELRNFKTYSFKAHKTDIQRIEKLANHEGVPAGHIVSQILEQLFSDCEGLPLPEPQPKEAWYSKTVEYPLVKTIVNGKSPTIKVVSKVDRKYLPLPEVPGEMRNKSVPTAQDMESLVVSLQTSLLVNLINLSSAFQMKSQDVLDQAIDRFFLRRVHNAVRQLPDNRMADIQAKWDNASQLNDRKRLNGTLPTDGGAA
ncbi:hypothetical protein IQ230_09705 [Gloeocapsopsis crepidinum LEGE 06123]|uniref:Uncharacterized protein n=1 Tax=Gloeocapsopsis crepidinum LEGE 06123 TaxID=588587 RepID=A0ABR9UQT1_9CHRO|nr:hypothetical protein [Gloeocapsopsis crepidinum]MBE9190631.1 hypothetical protein [Gloeocapsopsis crepidinum LEGE 06123]